VIEAGLALGEAIGDDALEGLGAVGGCHTGMGLLLVGARDGGPVKVLLELDGRIVDVVQQHRLERNPLGDDIARVVALQGQSGVVHCHGG
jgi:hypothetical protein